MARVTAKEVWEIQELLTVIKAEVEAREISDTIKINERKGTDGYMNRRFNLPSTSALTTQARHGEELSVFSVKKAIILLHV